MPQINFHDWNKRVPSHHEPQVTNEDLNKQLNIVLRKLQIMATTLDDILTQVEAEKTAEESLIKLVQGIRQQLIDILAGALTPVQQAKVDAVFAKMNDNIKEVSDAIDANQPPTPPAPTV
jgi:molecular chaperone GrpE (heat shock protein)